MPESRPIALITGASRGIGRAIAIELAPTHRLIGTYRGRRDAADSLQAQIGAVMIQSDISSARDRKALVECIQADYGTPRERAHPLYHLHLQLHGLGQSRRLLPVQGSS